VAEVKPLLQLVEQHLPMAEASFEQLFIKGQGGGCTPLQRLLAFSSFHQAPTRGPRLKGELTGGDQASSHRRKMETVQPALSMTHLIKPTSMDIDAMSRISITLILVFLASSTCLSSSRSSGILNSSIEA
jgi:hypothetical protein